MSSVIVRATVLLTLAGCGFSEMSNGSPSETDTMTDPSAGAPDVTTEPEPNVPEPEVDSGSPAPSVPPTVQLSRSTDFDGFLADGAGQPLYIYATDIPGTKLTTCLDACARTWKPYDADPTLVGPGLDPAEVARYHRQDGDWQLTYKGFPLYRRADEMGATSPTVIISSVIEGKYRHWAPGWYARRKVLNL